MATGPHEPALDRGEHEILGARNGQSPRDGCGRIRRLGSTQRLDGVVWTNLPCKFNGVNGAIPTEDDVADSLRALEGEQCDLAEEYVRKAPREVDTPHRRRIEREFGWTYDTKIFRVRKHTVSVLVPGSWHAGVRSGVWLGAQLLLARVCAGQGDPGRQRNGPEGAE